MTTESLSKIKSLEGIFSPKSAAVVGASSRYGSLGNMVLKKMIDFGYKGALYPINPNSEEILGVKCYPSILDVPGAIDLAIICVPYRFVLDVIKDCHKKGISSAVIISAGFKEIGGEGIKREEELNRLREEYGMRIAGPNCFGVINGNPAVSMDCTFARNLPPRGHLGFISQSGAMGACMLEDLKKTVMGFSLFISLGNRSDINENEALEYLAADENTHVILLYLENFADPMGLISAAKKITPYKPIIALKAGKSKRGAAAAASHTGMLAQSDTMADALMEKAGIIRVDSVSEMIMTAKALYGGSIPETEGLAIITNAGGFGVMAVDKAEKLDIQLASFEEKTQEYLKNNLPVEASTNNPVDLLGTAGVEDYSHALAGLLQDKNVGAVVCNFGPPVMQSAEEIAQITVDQAKKYPNKPVLSVFMNRYRIMKAIQESKDVYVSQFDYPEDAVWAYSQMLKYKKIKEKKAAIDRVQTFDRERVSHILKNAVSKGIKQLDFNQGEEILQAYGIPTAKSLLIHKSDNLQEKLASFKFPVAIKPAGGEISHKTEMKAVKLNLDSIQATARALKEIADRIEKHTGKTYQSGFIVQEMKTNCKEVIMGAVRQDSGIHLLMFGLGGIFVELLKDVSFAVPPLDEDETESMIKSIKAYPILKGFRGDKGAALEDLKKALLSLSCLVEDFPEIKEIDINPFMASSKTGESAAVDVRIIL